MRKLSILLLLFVLVTQTTFAAFVQQTGPANESASSSQASEQVKSQMERESGSIDGRKLSLLERWQYKKIQRKIQKNHSAIFPERDELTEGFQALPFFGSILTCGLLWLIMLFTARDRNALRWAGNGIAILAIAFSVASIIALVSY
ncbi:MAG: hypothetical protein MUE71_09840 [Chitinophagaceae bacterium]|jgi:hypothetical protein|nr:hypothetical protein [Chitinophagaceae bacterium]